MPFSLAFGAKAVVQAEISIPTIRSQFTVEEHNNAMLNFELDTIDKKREVVAAQITYYKQQAAKYYNKNVRTRTFQVGNWVLIKVFQNTKETGARKLGPNWEGP